MYHQEKIYHIMPPLDYLIEKGNRAILGEAWIEDRSGH
jgi:hypothetical protein